MSKLTLVEKIVQAHAKGEPMPLKGHARIVLTDARDGTVKKVVESDNIVTNAMASIIGNNWNLKMDATQILPLSKLFGGVLLFGEEITENADNIGYPNSYSNPLYAHAGSEPNTTASTKRGNPVSSDFVYGDTYLTQKWEWGTTHGNTPPDKYLKCVCLCPETLGNLSLEPVPTDGQYFSLMGIPDIGTSQDFFDLSRSKCIEHPFEVNSDGQTGTAIYWSGTAFEEIVVRHDWLKHGIVRTNADYQEVSHRSATVRSFTSTKASFFADSEYYYLYEVTSATAIKIDKVKKSDFTVTQADLTLSDVSLNTGAVWSSVGMAIPAYAYDGTYLYLPNSAKTGFVAVNPNDSSDKWNTDGSITLDTDGNVGSVNTARIQPIVVSPRVVVGTGYIINGQTAYQTAVPFAYTSNNGHLRYYVTHKKGASLFCRDLSRYNSTNATHTSAPMLCSSFLSTINNIEPVQKTTSMNMEVIYTLRET